MDNLIVFSFLELSGLLYGQLFFTKETDLNFQLFNDELFLLDNSLMPIEFFGVIILILFNFGI